MVDTRDNYQSLYHSNHKDVIQVDGNNNLNNNYNYLNNNYSNNNHLNGNLCIKED